MIGRYLCKEKQTMPIQHDQEHVREKHIQQDPQWLPPPDDTGLADVERARNQGMNQGVPPPNPAAKRAGRAKTQNSSKSKSPASKSSTSKSPASKSPASKSKSPAKAKKSKS
jgi:hypothetical protein